jgi:ATP-dependent DNA helicase PIF1
VAALRAGGQTLHSFFRMQPGILLPGDDGTKRPTELYRGISTLIIDEVSMVRADVIDKIDEILRRARESSAPFGGVQVLLFGDPLQLPPVVERKDGPILVGLGYRGPHFFDAAVTRGEQLETFVLDRVHRQRDQRFIDVLNAFRRGAVGHDLMRRLNRRVIRRSPVVTAGGLTLTTHCWRAGVVNEQHLNDLPTPEASYRGTVQGVFPDSQLPVPKRVRLKVGARVMFVKNDREGRWVNGTIGTVLECGGAHVLVEAVQDRRICEVRRVEWERHAHVYDARTRKIERRVTGRYVQLPLSLGWAATVHKAQGLTLERVHVDLGRGAFAAGQAYVAISRSRTEQGLSLERPVRPADVIVDPRVVEFLDSRARRCAA